MSTYVMIPSWRARELAESSLDRIFVGRKNVLEHYIKDRQEKINASWWRRLLRLKPLTYEQVYEREERLMPLWDNQVCRIEYYWSDQESLAKKVKRAAEVAEAVNISVDDLEVLSG